MTRKFIFAFAATILSVLQLAAQETPLKFAFLTDLHYSEGSRSVKDLSRCIADVNSQKDFDFVLIGGDLTDFGTDEEIAAVKQMLDSLDYKYYVVPGNHDATWSESGCNTFRKVFGYETYEFECKGWRFLGCSCGPDMRMSPALVPQESMEWLKSLKPGEKTIFINHYPQDTSVLNYFDVTREVKRIGARFEIGGHWHKNTVLNYDGLPGVLGRSTLSAGLNPGYTIFTIQNDSITVAERRLYGSTPVLFEPWYSSKLVEVKDNVAYDSDGLPESYPWIRYDVNKTSPVKKIWQFKDNSNIVAGFARQGDFAWYTTASGWVRCIKVKNGSNVWSKEFPGKIFSTPAFSGGIVVFGCSDGYVYALDAKNGSLKWKVAAKKSIVASPAIYDGVVYIGASDGVFRAIDLKTGKIVWDYALVDGFVECRPYVDAGQVVFGTWGRKLYSLDPKSGALQWMWECAKPSRMYSPAAVWPVKADGKIFIAVPDRRLYVLDAASGKELTHFDSSAREAVGLSEDGKTVYCKPLSHRLISIDTHSLEVNWNVNTGAGYEMSPTAITENSRTGVIMPTDKGNLLGYDIASGKHIWSYKFSPALVNPLEVWNEKGKTMILASAMDGTVTLLEY